jgi:hypothetical protein
MLLPRCSGSCESIKLNEEGDLEHSEAVLGHLDAVMIAGGSMLPTKVGVSEVILKVLLVQVLRSL